MSKIKSLIFDLIGAALITVALIGPILIHWYF